MKSLEKKIKKILNESKSIDDAENKILSLKLHTLPDTEEVSEVMFKIVPSLKDSLFKSYQNYCVFYISLLVTIQKSNIPFDKFNLVYPMIFNLHQAIELFYKSYKVFYHNLYGYDSEPTRVFRTSTPQEIEIKGHCVETLFDDSDILFVFELFGIDKLLVNKIKISYLEIKNIIGLQCVSDQSRYPQGVKNFLPDKIKKLNDKEINTVFSKIYDIIRCMIECLSQQYNMKDLDKETALKLINRCK